MKQAVPFLASSLVLSGLLAGCAPSSTGQSSSAPQVLKTPLTPVELAPGETRYVRVDYPRKSLRLGQGYFDKLNIDFSNMSGNNVNSPMEYANWLKMGSPKLPRGVQISLDKAFIVKDIDRTYENSGGTEVYYYEVFRLVTTQHEEHDKKSLLGKSMPESRLIITLIAPHPQHIIYKLTEIYYLNTPIHALSSYFA